MENNRKRNSESRRAERSALRELNAERSGGSLVGGKEKDGERKARERGGTGNATDTFKFAIAPVVSWL